MRSIHSGWLTVGPVLLSLGLTATVLFASDQVVRYLFWPTADQVAIWPQRSVSIVVLVALLIGPLLSLLVARKMVGTEGESEGLRWVRPLYFLPWSVIPLLLAVLLPIRYSSWLVLMAPLGLLSAAFSLWLQRDRPLSGRPGQWVTGWILLSLLFFWFGGWYLTWQAGEHQGDEGHYLIQARSLYQDHDLDLRNNFNSIERKRLQKDYSLMHINTNSRDGACYSWHSFGLPLLLAPLEPWGIGARHLMLGLISALGIGGVLLSCLLLGSRLPTALVFVTLYACSTSYGLFAFRALPETIGTALTAWLFAGILLVGRCPRWALALLLITTVALPFMHTRFAPISVLGAIWYVVAEYRHGPSRHRLSRLLAFLLIALAGVGLYAFINHRMFTSGSSYPIRETLFAYLPGMWKILVSGRSLTYMLPLFAWSLWAMLWCAIRFPACRAPGCFAGILLLAIAATSCTYPGWGGGSSPVGRYLLVATPVFIPFAALYSDHCSVITRWFGLLLAGISCAFLLLILYHLDMLGRTFVDPRLSLSSFVPVFKGLGNPFIARWDWYGILLYLTVGLLLFLPRGAKGLQVLSLLFLFIVTLANSKPDTLAEALLDGYVIKENQAVLKRTKLEQALVLKSGSGTSHPVEAVVANRFSSYHAGTLGAVTTEYLEPAVQGNLASQPRLPVNDWSGRPLRWMNLIGAFDDTAGGRLLCLTGQVEGTARLTVAVAELSANSHHIALETEIPTGSNGAIGQCLSMNLDDTGKVYLLLRLDGGNGLARFDSLAWYPIDAGFADTTKLVLPQPLLSFGP